MEPTLERCRRIAIVGTSGSGKTTLARHISQKLGIPHVELDKLHWEPNWIEAPDKVFEARVTEALSGDCWVVDGNYGKVRPLVWERADTAVWLDYPFLIVMKQILQRTIRRVALGEDCCNGNRETFQQSFLSRDSVILWAFQTYEKNRERYSRLFQQADYAHLKKIRLSSPQMTQGWLKDSL